jgi:hypothetical protein
MFMSATGFSSGIPFENRFLTSCSKQDKGKLNLRNPTQPMMF